MQKALDIFDANIVRVRSLGGVYSAVTSLTTPILDCSDILRAQMVLVVSALDYYIHAVTLMGMLECFQNKRTHTSAFLKYTVSINTTISSTSIFSTLENEIRMKHSFLSFQRPEKIADAIRLFSDEILWREVSKKIRIPESKVKDTLDLIIDRRNKIAHEADVDPSFPKLRWPIHESDVNSSIDFIEKIVHAIHLVII